jgi:pyruvate/2-oxoglutarate dehydrogenase complex dihydrolipoamide acyltransferase (E2) component
MPPDRTPYVNVSTHAQPLASGRVLAPGESAPISDGAHDQALVTDGALVPAETQTDYAAMRHEQLAALAEGAELEVKGSGKDGAVTNADLVKALTAHNKKEA